MRFVDFSSTDDASNIDISNSVFSENHAEAVGGEIYINSTKPYSLDNWPLLRHTVCTSTAGLYGNCIATFPSSLNVTHPNQVLRRVHFEVYVTLLDKFGNIVKNFPGELRLQGKENEGAEASKQDPIRTSGVNKFSIEATSESHNITWVVYDINHPDTITADFSAELSECCPPGYQKVCFFKLPVFFIFFKGIFESMHTLPRVHLLFPVQHLRTV